MPTLLPPFLQFERRANCVVLRGCSELGLVVGGWRLGVGGWWLGFVVGVWGLGVWVLGFAVWSLGFGVWGLGLTSPAGGWSDSAWALVESRCA